MQRRCRSGSAVAARPSTSARDRASIGRPGEGERLRLRLTLVKQMTRSGGRGCRPHSIAHTEAGANTRGWRASATMQATCRAPGAALVAVASDAETSSAAPLISSASRQKARAPPDL
eukprot:scaffold131399_cov48-Phaeocystis_antarctica.AAC.1